MIKKRSALSSSFSSDIKASTVQSLTSDSVTRHTDELVIGMVGAVGAGVSTTTKILKEMLETEYGYEVRIIKISQIIRDNFAKSSCPMPSDVGANRVVDLQKIGSDLRSKFGDGYLTGKAIENIGVTRVAEGGYDASTTVPQPISLRRATIIDSLKHHEETKLLRQVYGEVYWQFTVFAPESVREDRLKRDGIDRSALVGIFTTDDNDPNDHGQKVSKTAYLSDFFVRNDAGNDQRLKASLSRFLSLMFDIEVQTPTTDESAMYTAVSAANRSACLSRQVGAAIYSNSQELVSIGWNDVPRALGGLYNVTDAEKDHRCFKWGGKVCHNDRKKEELYNSLYKKLKEDGQLTSNSDFLGFRKSISGTPVRDLIEYSRAIHAEMEAIVSASRLGKLGVVGGSLFTTTFPCHNCARHIVAAGISKVFYIEPYSKSLAIDLHSDAISLTEDGNGKVAFLQYEGVGPESMLKLFQNGHTRKNDGKSVIRQKKTASPVLPPPMDGFSTHEKRVIDRIKAAEGT